MSLSNVSGPLKRFIEVCWFVLVWGCWMVCFWLISEVCFEQNPTLFGGMDGDTSVK